MTDPDATTMLIWLLLFCAAMSLFAWWADRKTRRRPNRYRSGVMPAPDARCIVGNWGGNSRAVEGRE